MARSVTATVDRSVSPTSLRGRFAATCEPFLSGLVAMTFFARFYLPTEDTANGATLWIVAIWFVIGLFALLMAWRGRGAARRCDGCDAAVLLLIGGQVASAVMIVATTGDKRAAVNIAWEWIGAGIVWFVLRSRVGGTAFREMFVRASVITGCILAGLGLWQHYVSQPALVREYGPLFDRLREATGGEAEVIQRQLAKSGVPTEGPALTLFEKRIRDSREPMGLFGLTNTFGGCLAVWLVLTLASFRLSNAQRGRERLLVPRAVVDPASERGGGGPPPPRPSEIPHSWPREVRSRPLGRHAGIDRVVSAADEKSHGARGDGLRYRRLGRRATAVVTATWRRDHDLDSSCGCGPRDWNRAGGDRGRSADSNRGTRH